MSRNLKKQFTDRLNPGKRGRWPGVLGNAAGVIDAGSGYVYVRLQNGQTIPVYNDRVAKILNLPVIVGYDPHDKPNLMQVLSAWAVYDKPGQQGVRDHHENHEYPNFDTVWVHPEQILWLLCLPLTAFTIQIYGGVVLRNGVYVTVPNQELDLLDYTTVPTSGARYALIQVDNTGAASAKPSAAVATVELLDNALIPAVDGDSFPLCVVKLYDSQIELQRNPGGVDDFIDLRFTGASITGNDTQLDTTNFDGFLSAADDTIQKVADNYDDHTHPGDASDITYNPAVPADWDGCLEPDFADIAFDQLAERVTDVEGANSGDVTLDANADTILSLSTQVLGLDTQSANYVLAGAESGGAAVPAFRALVAADIPAEFATEEFVIDLVGATASYFYNPVDSDIVGYDTLTFTKPTAAITNYDQSVNASATTLIFAFAASVADSPAIVHEGLHDAHVHALVTGGNRTVTLRVTLHVRSAGGVDGAAFLTYDDSVALTGVELEYDLHGFLAADQAISVGTGERLVAKVSMVTTGGTNNTTARIRIAGTTFSHLSVGVNASAFDAVYIQRDTLTEQGDVLYASAASTPAALAHGSLNQVLVSGGHGANPLWDKIAVANLADGTDGQLITWDAAGAPAVVAVGTATHVLTSNGAGAAPTFQAAASAIYPPGFGFGCVLANGADATNDIDIAVGNWIDSGNTNNIILTGALVKQLDAVWAVGTNAGMRASGAAIANTTYHIFLILRPDTGVVDVCADTSVTGANIAANTNAAYTKFRRIGSIVRLAAAIKAFIQTVDTFMWSNPVQDVSANNPGTNAVTRTLTLPTGIKIKAIMAVIGVGNSAADCPSAMYFSDLSQPDLAASGTNIVANNYINIATQSQVGSWIQCYTDTSAQIRSRIQVSTAGTYVFLSTLGWIDSRGK